MGAGAGGAGVANVDGGLQCGKEGRGGTFWAICGKNL